MGWAVKRIVGFGMIVGMLVILTGCTVVFKTEGERELVEYELMDIRDVPEDMQKQIEKRKEEAFQITYRDMKYLRKKNLINIQNKSKKAGTNLLF